MMSYSCLVFQARLFTVRFLFQLIGTGRSTDCDGQQNLPVPSLRHRFGLSRPLSSPSTDLTSPGRIFNSRTCTNESDFPLQSTVTTKNHGKRRTPEGNADLSSCGNEDTLSEVNSTLGNIYWFSMQQLIFIYPR